MQKNIRPHSEHMLCITTDFGTNDDWRFEQPVWDNDKCIRCGTCYLVCPDSAVFQNDEGYYEADPRLCKGCGICRHQCWTGCITMEACAEQPSWVGLVKKIRS